MGEAVDLAVWAGTGPGIGSGWLAACFGCAGADLLQAAVVELAKVKRVTAVSLHLESADALLEEGNNLARIH